MTRVLAAAASFAFVVGCAPYGGESFGERFAGDDTFVDPTDFHDTGDGRSAAVGDIGVDPATERSYAVQAVADDATGAVRKKLFAVPPEASRADAIFDLSGRSDLRVLFVDGAVLLMAERNGTDTIELLDKDTLAIKDVIDTGAVYGGVGLSPSRRRISADAGRSLHVIDLVTHAVRDDAPTGQRLFGAWLNGEETLLELELFAPVDEETPARVHLTSVAFADGPVDRHPKHKSVDVDIASATTDALFSEQWIAVSPDDRTVALPLFIDGKQSVVLVDTDGGGARVVADVSGPVGFTPDGTTVVGYRTVAARCEGRKQDDCTRAQLVLVDVADASDAVVELPSVTTPVFFTARSGHTVVVADAAQAGALVVADLDTGRAHRCDGPATSLGEFVTRDTDVFVADKGLFQLDLVAGTSTALDVGFAPSSINYLPRRDRLVVDDGHGTGIAFVDPASGDVTAHAAFE